MSKRCEEKHAGRGHPRPSALTRQRVAQQMKALQIHSGHRSFSPLLRCKPLKGNSLPAALRLTGSKNTAARRGKI